ncbi:hypothetical protein KJD10_05715 (plasmid) [Borreliella valaisiana]|nr:hypothetical protein [Borreliella valaisiana]WLN25909.1 hypothetical protein KJD10_05715 [Borreliella valaisiana]
MAQVAYNFKIPFIIITRNI